MSRREIPEVPEDVESLAARSSLVFTGVVAEVSGSSEAAEATAKVRVELIHDAPPLLVDYQGQVVDVFVSESGDVGVGDRRVFFANPLEFGTGLVLSGVGSLEAFRDPEVLDDALVQVRDQERERALSERVAGSVAVLHGVVTGLDRVRGDELAVSEHDPQWWIARVDVIDVFKGEAADEVLVRFANSRDVAWNDAPKLHPDQEGILILQEDPREGVEERLAVLAEDDVRTPSASELELIRRLVG